MVAEKVFQTRRSAREIRAVDLAGKRGGKSFRRVSEEIRP